MADIIDHLGSMQEADEKGVARPFELRSEMEVYKLLWREGGSSEKRVGKAHSVGKHTQVALGRHLLPFSFLPFVLEAEGDFLQMS